MSSDPAIAQGPPAASGQLAARPSATTTGSRFPVGLHPLGLEADRDALLYVPSRIKEGSSLPLIVMLHGAGGDAQHGINPLVHLAESKGFLLLAPASRNQTWDVIARSRYGPDIAFLDAALTEVFTRTFVNPAQIAIAGFSDGASYALSLGVMNGDLFTHCIAFAPGFMAPRHAIGKADFYIAHGTQDAVLNIDRCSRRIVPSLQQAGYSVLYKEFNGPHTVPPAIAEEAVDWFLDIAKP